MKLRRWLLTGLLMALLLTAPVMEARGRMSTRARVQSQSEPFWMPISEQLRQIFRWLLYGPNPWICIPQNPNRRCPPGVM